MNINIDDEMLRVASEYDAHLHNPDFSLDSVEEYEKTKRTLLSMLMAKIETAEIEGRLAS